MPRPPDRDWRRAARLRFGAAAALFVIGAVLAAVGDGVADLVAVVVMGVAAVLAVSFVFLEIGLSEDRERAREGPGPPGPPRA
jgi:fatty acid desaturase